MELYLLRHGDAADADPARGITEELRPLTPDGARQVEAVAQGLRRAGVQPDVLFTSPLVRAAETAAIAARVLAVAGPVQPRKALRPGCGLDDVADLLREAGAARSVLLVGHNPDLSRVAAELSGRDVNLNLEKGGLARIDLKGAPKPGKGTLVWLLTPEVFGAA